MIPSEETHRRMTCRRPRTINPRRARTGLNGGTCVRTWALRGDPARPPHLSCYCFPKENVISGPRFPRSPQRSLAVAAASLTTGSPPPALTEEGESKGPLLRERKKAARVIPSAETHSAASACRPRTINPRRARTGLNGGTSVRTWALRGDPARPPHLSCYCFPKENVLSRSPVPRSGA